MLGSVWVPIAYLYSAQDSSAVVVYSNVKYLKYNKTISNM